MYIYTHVCTLWITLLPWIWSQYVPQPCCSLIMQEPFMDKMRLPLFTKLIRSFVFLSFDIQKLILAWLRRHRGGLRRLPRSHFKMENICFRWTAQAPRRLRGGLRTSQILIPSMRAGLRRLCEGSAEASVYEKYVFLRIAQAPRWLRAGLRAGLEKMNYFH